MRIWNILVLLVSLTVTSVEAATPTCDKDAHDVECRKYPHSPYNDIRTEQLLKEVPRGIVFEQDTAVLSAYQMFNNNLWSSSNYASGAEVAKSIMGVGNIPTNDHVLEDTKMRSPAFYFAAAKMGILGSVTDFDKLNKENPALSKFVAGLGNFFYRWEGVSNEWKKGEAEENATRYLFTSLLVCSNRPTSAYDAYIKMPLDKKRLFLSGLMEDIRKNRDSYLVTAWSSLLLTNHLDLSGKKDHADLIYTHIERPSRDLVGYSVRGRKTDANLFQ